MAMNETNINPELTPSMDWEQLKTMNLENTSQLREIPSTVDIELRFPLERDNLSVVYTLNTENLNVEGFSFKSDSPEIYAPLQTAETAQTPQNQNAVAEFWSKIDPGFMGIFLSGMIDLFAIQVSTSLNLAKSDLNQREQKIAITTTLASLTKLLGESQANEKMMEALGSFMQAGLGAIQLASMTRNVATAQKSVEQRIEQAGKDVDTARQKTGIGAIDGKPLSELSPEEKKSVLEKSPKLKAAEDNLTDLQSRKQTYIQDEVRRLDQLDGVRFEVLKNIVNATVQTVGASFKTEQGALQALKETEQGYHDATQTNMQDAQKNRESLEAAINKMLDLLKSLFDMNVRSKMFKG